MCNCKYMFLGIGHQMKHDDPFSSAARKKILPNFLFIEFVNHISENVICTGAQFLPTLRLCGCEQCCRCGENRTRTFILRAEFKPTASMVRIIHLRPFSINLFLPFCSTTNTSLHFYSNYASLDTYRILLFLWSSFQYSSIFHAILDLLSNLQLVNWRYGKWVEAK